MQRNQNSDPLNNALRIIGVLSAAVTLLRSLWDLIKDLRGCIRALAGKRSQR